MQSYLLQHFEELLLRVYSGDTLTQALEGMPTLPASKREAARWISVKSEILDGKISCATALESHVSQLRREQRLRILWRRKSQGPLIQSIGVFLSGILFFLASLIIFPSELRPGAGLCSFYLVLSGLGAFWMKHLLTQWKTLEAEGHWLAILHEFHHGLLSGNTFQTLRRDATLNQNLQKQLKKHRKGIINVQWRSICRLDEEGKPLSTFLKSAVEQYQIHFESKVEEEAERLNFKLLAPMFLCQVPAQMSLILFPLIQRLGDLG